LDSYTRPSSVCGTTVEARPSRPRHRAPHGGHDPSAQEHAEIADVGPPATQHAVIVNAHAYVDRSPPCSLHSAQYVLLRSKRSLTRNCVRVVYRCLSVSMPASLCCWGHLGRGRGEHVQGERALPLSGGYILARLLGIGTHCQLLLHSYDLAREAGCF